MSELNIILDKMNDQILKLERELEEQQLIRKGLLKHMEDLGISTNTSTNIDRVYPNNVDSTLSLPPEKKKTLRAAIEEACLSLQPNEMLVVDIEEILRKNNELPNSKSPRASIAMVMKKLVDEGIMMRTYVGTGSEPHRFKVIEEDNKETQESKGEDSLVLTDQ